MCPHRVRVGYDVAVPLSRQAPNPQKFQVIRSLRHRNFLWYWLGNVGQSAAQGMQFLILGWLVLELTDSSSQLGLVIFLYGVPNFAILAFGGIVADRFDRRLLLIVSQAGVVLVIAAISVVTLADMVEMWHVYATAFILGLIQGMNMPARMAIVADLVERDDIMNAVSLNMTVMNFGRIIGPAVAGGLIEIAGIGPALLLNAGSYLFGLVFLILVRGVSSHKQPDESTIIRELSEGVRHFWTTPIVYTVIGIGMAFGFFAAAYMQVLPAFAKAVLDVGAGGAGLLISAAGIGSLVGSLALAFLGDFERKNLLLLGTAIMFSVSLLLLAWSSWFWVSWAILLFVGMGSMGYVSVGTTILQLSVPSEMHGRIMSLWLFGAALNYVGALPMGIIADLFSWPIAFAYGAIFFALVVFWMGIWKPTLRRVSGTVS